MKKRGRGLARIENYVDAAIQGQDEKILKSKEILIKAGRNSNYNLRITDHFTLDSHIIMLSVKQGSIKYHFLSLWYDSTWD